MSNPKVVSLTSRRGRTTLDIVMERLEEGYVLDAPSAKFADDYFKSLLEKGWTVKQAGLISNILIPSDAPTVSLKVPGVEVEKGGFIRNYMAWSQHRVSIFKVWDPRSGIVGGLIVGTVVSTIIYFFSN